MNQSTTAARYTKPRLVNDGIDPKKAKKQVKRLRFGESAKFGGVTVAAISTEHSNGVSPNFILDKDLAKAMKKSGLTAYAGPDTGFVVYLSADTGHVSDMDTTVRRYYGAELAIMNMGDRNTMGPKEAAWTAIELNKAKAVIPTHANEASAKGSKVVAGTKVDRFIKAVNSRTPYHIPLSGKAFEFDGDAKSVKGC